MAERGGDIRAELERREGWPAQEGGEEGTGTVCQSPRGTRAAIVGELRVVPCGQS